MTASEEVTVIGDVHGDARRLGQALEAKRHEKSRVVLVGDYVNKGADVRQVLDLLCQAKATLGEQLILLRGNHDQVLLNFLHSGDPSQLVAHCGVATVRSYLPGGRGGFAEFRETFPQEHRWLLEDTADFYETSDMLITHSGFNPWDVASRKAEDVRGPGYSEQFSHEGPWPRPLTVCGHFTQRDRKPFVSDRLICIDTGCGAMYDGVLTVLHLPSRRIDQF